MSSAATPDSLDAFLEAAVRRFDGQSPLTAQILHHFAYDGNPGEAGRYVHFRLALAVAEEEGADPCSAAVDAASAIEVLHQSAVVHEDVDAADATRYGRPTVWSRFGLAHGINAGDALCAIAYLQLLEPPAGRDPARTVLMTRRLHEANYAMCAGLAAGIEFAAAQEVTPANYLAMAEGTTCALFGAACELGALAAGADESRAQAYARLGRTYALAFHIEDDVVDAWGTGTALARRAWTYPVAAALAGPHSAARTRLAAVYAPGTPLDAAGVASVRDALDALGARDASLAAARAYLAEADAVAAAAGIDRSGRVRAFFTRSVRRIG
jgi:geranylgeranyl diphosphate synthase type I